MLITASIIAVLVLKMDNVDNLEIIICKVKHGNTWLHIGCIYRSQCSKAFDVALFLLTKYGRKQSSLLMGDFNAPNISYSPFYGLVNAATFDRKLLQKTIDIPPVQHVTEVTRRSEEQAACLDLVFTRYIGEIHNLTYEKDRSQ